MPWHQAPKKDVISCEKPRLAANEQRAADVRMRERLIINTMGSCDESIVVSKGTRGTETSKYPEEKKVKKRYL